MTSFLLRFKPFFKKLFRPIWIERWECCNKVSVRLIKQVKNLPAHFGSVDIGRWAVEGPNGGDINLWLLHITLLAAVSLCRASIYLDCVASAACALWLAGPLETTEAAGRKKKVIVTLDLLEKLDSCRWLLFELEKKGEKNAAENIQIHYKFFGGRTIYFDRPATMGGCRCASCLAPVCGDNCLRSIDGSVICINHAYRHV